MVLSAEKIMKLCWSQIFVNITYGRGVGYAIEEEEFDKSISEISATKIREEMKMDGKL